MGGEVSLTIPFFVVADNPDFRDGQDRPHTGDSYMPRCARCKKNEARFGTLDSVYLCSRCLRDRVAVYRLNSVYFKLTRSTK